MKPIVRLFPRCCAMMFVIPLVLATTAMGQDWSMTTADFKTVPVQLVGISPAGCRVVQADSKSEIVVGFERFVSLQRPAGDESSSAATHVAAMNNGDRIVGQPQSVEHEKLKWNNPSVGVIPLSLSRLVSVTRGAKPWIPDPQPKQDLITLSNGDTVSGIFTDCADHTVRMQTDAGPAAFPLDGVKRIEFAATGSVAEASTSRAFRIRLADSSIFTVASAESAGKKLKLKLASTDADGLEVGMDQVLGIEQLNGPLSWLSSRTPTENIQKPYFGGAESWPARMDLSVDGSPLCYDGKVFDHGIGVHAYSRLTFAIDPQWQSFRTQYAIDSKRDQPRKYAEVTVRILLDGKVVREQKNLRDGELSPVVSVDLKDAKSLTLECDYGNAGDTQAHLDWLEPAFLHELSRADTQPAPQP